MSFPRYTQDFLDSAQGAFPTVAREGKRVRPVGIRVFENGVLEWISKSPPILPIFWTGPFIAYGIYGGVTGVLGLGKTILFFFAGWLLWSFLEYLLHRFAFHLPAHTPTEKFRFFIMHGYHHDFPSDPLRLVAPPMLGWPMGVIFGSIYYVCFGPTLWLVLFAGTMTGYVAYDWIHYYTHHARPTSRLGKWIRRYHMEHHYLDHDAHYGVSSPLWDVVFGTFRARRTVSASTSSTKVMGLKSLRLELTVSNAIFCKQPGEPGDQNDCCGGR